MPHLWPTGSSLGSPPSTTARYFSAYPSDPASRRAPCPPKHPERWLQVRLGCVQLSPACPFRRLHTFRSLRPARHYPRFWIRRPSSERRRDLNPPDLGAAQRTLRSRPTPPAFRGGFALLSFPPRPEAAAATAGGKRSPRFRRDPFVRELVSDPGRAAAPRITAPLMLPSTVWNASAPALKLISWLNTDPTRWLCTLRRGRHLPRRNTRYRRALPLTWAGLAPAGPRQLRLAHPRPTLWRAPYSKRSAWMGSRREALCAG